MKLKIRLTLIAAAITGLVLALTLVTSVSADPPDSWYVSTTGNNYSGCGALADPCLTISYTISNAVNGSTVTTQNGVGSAVIVGPRVAGLYSILIDSDDVTLSELEVRNDSTVNRDVIYQSGSYTGTVVTGTVVHDCGDECIQLKQCTNCLIENVTVYDAAQDGLNFANSRNSTIRNKGI